MCPLVPKNIVLIGFSGTGKSSVGKSLAERLGWGFVDTDQLIVARFGRPIADLFREQGEAIFRAAEREALVEACAGQRQIISLGGGATVDPANRAHIREGNLIIRLEATPPTILRRLRTSPNAEERPLLAGGDPLERIRAMLVARADAYGIAEAAIDTEGRTPDEVAAEIQALVSASFSSGLDDNSSRNSAISNA